MKKRVLSLFLAAVLCLSLLPTAGFAEDVDLSGNTTVGGETGGESGGVLVDGNEETGGGVYEDTRTEIWRDTSRYQSISRSYDGTTDGSMIKVIFPFTDGSNEIQLEEGKDCEAEKTFDSADAGSRIVTVELKLIGDAATKYKLKEGSEKFTIGGNINKAYPALTVSLSKTTCAVGEKLLSLLSVEGVQEDAAVTYYYTPIKSGYLEFEGSDAVPKIDENTAISETGTYYVYAKTAETKNYEEQRSTTVELTVAEKVDPVASVTAADGTETTYGSFTDAWTAAIANNGSTLKLLADGTLSGKVTDNTDLDKSLTLDLNGYMLGSNGSLTVKNGAALTVKNAGAENSKEPVKVGLYLTLLVEKGGSFTCTDGKIQYLGLQDASEGDYSIKLADGESHCTFGGFAKRDENATIGDLLKATPGMALHADNNGSDVQIERSTLINSLTYFTYHVGACSEHKIGTDGTCIYCGASYVASVTTSSGESTNYTSLDDALDAAQDGDTVTLQGDAEISKGQGHDLRKAITLELNGKTITTQPGAELRIRAKVIIQDNSTGEIGTMVCNDYGTYILNVQGGELTIKSGTFAGKITAPAGGKSKLTIEGGTFNNDVNLSAVSASLSGGSFTSIWQPEGSFLDRLADGYAFYDNEGKLVNAAKNGYLYNVKVQEHKQHTFTDGKCDCGYTCPHTSVGADGKCTVCNKQFAASVTVGEEVTYYDAFYKALNAASAGSTLTLLADVTEFGVTLDREITLDLNGHSISILHVTAEATLTDSAAVKGTIGTLNIGNSDPNADAPTIVLGDLVIGGDSFKTGDTWLAAAQLFGTSATDVSVAATGITGVTAKAPESVIYGQTGTNPITIAVTPEDIEMLTFEWFERKGNNEWSSTGTGGNAYNPAALNAGSHTIRCAVTSTAGYVLSDAVTVTVTKASIAGASVTLVEDSFTYDGKAKIPEVESVSLYGAPLPIGSYYVEVTPQTNVGSYTLTVKGNGNYSGEIKDVAWKIEPMKIKSIKDVSSVSKDYDGSADVTLPKANVTFLDDANKEISLPENAFTITNARFTTRQDGFVYEESPNAGTRKSISFTLNLTDINYAFAGEEASVRSCDFSFEPIDDRFTITKETALAQATEVTLYVTNDLVKTYEVDLAALLPKLTMPCEYGDISYTVNADGLNKDYYTSGATVTNGKLSLPINNVSTEKESSIGTVTVTVTSVNYENITLTIPVCARNKLTPNQTGVTVSASDITYGQTLNESKLTATGTMKHPGTGEEIPGTFAWTDSTFKPDAGDYEAEWTFTPAKGYEEYATATGTVTVKVNKADPTVTAPTVKTLTYTGSEQPLLTAGTAQGGTMQYRLGDSGEFAASIPKGKDARTYTVYYKVGGDSNHNDTAEQSITVTINPMKLLRFVSTAAVTKTYDGTANVPLSEVTVTFNSRTASSVSLPNDAYSITNARFTMKQTDGSYADSPEVGKGKSLSFTVTLRSNNYVFEAGENEDPKTIVCDVATNAEGKFTITKASAPTNIQTGTLNIINGTTLTYTYDSSKLLPAAPKGEYGVVYYGGEPSSDFETGYAVNSCQVGINSGVLTLTIDAQNGEKTGKIGSVTIYVTTDNYETISMPIDLYAVNKITPVVDGDITATEITYGDTLIKSKISGKMKDLNTGATVEGTFSWQDPNYTPENAGKYQRGWKFTPKDTNNYAEATGDVEVTVNNAKQSATLVMSGYTYGKTPVTPRLEDRKGNLNAEVTYYYFSVDGGTMQTWNIDNPPNLNAGTYTMRAVIAGTQNYDSFTTTDVKFAVAKATPDFTSGTTYTKPTGLTAIYGQTLADVKLTNPEGNLDGTWSWMDSTKSVGDASTDAKKFKAKFTPADTDNYNTVENIELEVTVNKADQAALTIQGEDTVVYGQTLTLTTTGGTTDGKVTYSVDASSTGGGGATVDENGVLTPTKVGTVSVTATRAGNENYNDVTSAPFVLMVKPATPTGAPSYTKITTSGKTLADAALTTEGSTLKPNAGKLEWVDDKNVVLPGETQVEANTTYKWLFTPDSGNYTTLTGEIELYHRSSGGGGGATAPSITVPVSSEQETVKVDATVSGSTADVEITDKQLDQVTSGGDTVTVDVSGLKDVDSAKLPPSIVEKAGQTDAELTVVLPTGSVALDTKALAAIEGTKDVTVSVRPATLTDAQREIVGARTEVAAVVDVKVLVGAVEQTGFGGGRLTVAIPYTPKAGEDTARLTVWFLRDDGSIEDMGGRYDAKTGCFVFQTDHLSRYLLVDKGFVDVPAGSYYEDAVAWAVANGITTGTDATHFAPDGSCTRAQAVTFLWRAAGSPAPKSAATPYTDVPAGSYYHDAVLWAVEQGITKGTSDTTFSPNATCTRAQIVTFLWRSEGTPAAGGKAPFTDVSADAYYADAVQWAVEQGITKGTSETTFGPNDDCTRAQIVTFLWRCME